MLTDEQIQNNKYRYIELFRSVHRSGFDCDRLIDMLENSDMFIAPASARNHNNIPGGLCDHCLKVYDNLTTLNEIKQAGYDRETLIIAALCHDFAKINFYERTAKNVKKYCTEEEYRADPKAYKTSDSLGNFKWDAELGYSVIKDEDRFLFGNHEETCEYIARCYVPLTTEESAAILHHMGGVSYDSNSENLSPVFRRYHLALLLHIADCMAAYMDEEKV